MKTWNKSKKFGVPVFALGFGILLMLEPTYIYSLAGPIIKGRLVYLVGVLSIMFGLVGFVATLLEINREGSSPSSDDHLDLG